MFLSSAARRLGFKKFAKKLKRKSGHNNSVTRGSASELDNKNSYKLLKNEST
jgi:hypothetical protein